MKNVIMTITVNESLMNYVQEFYYTESIPSICEKFSVNRQVVSGVVRRLNKLGLIDKARAYSKTIAISAKESNKNSVEKPYKAKRKLLKQLRTMESIQTTKNFNNHNGIAKMQCRTMVAEYIGKISGRNPRILTLPSDKWIWEKEILRHKSESKFIAVEYNIETYNNMVKNYIDSIELRNSVECMHNCTMGEVISKSKTEEYSHMILDYCGIINTFHDEINEVLIRDLVKVDGLISITLSKSNRHNNDLHKVINNTLSAIPKGIFGTEQSDAEFCTKLSIANMVLNQGGKYKIVATKDYNDTKGQGMMLFVIQRVK